MSEIQFNSANVPNPQVKPQAKAQPNVQAEAETIGTIASASTNTPSPLFSASSSETCGNIASSSTPSSSSGGGTNYVC
ncbi:hypothetical protein IJX73_03475 [bacterium]|nr:hypothetical protein [bacterium]